MIVNHSSPLATVPDSDADSDSLLAIVRWPILVVASLALVVFTLGRADAVGAAAPATYDSTICINYFTCYNAGTGAPVSNTTSGYPTYVAPTTTNTGYPPNAVVSTYFDPRYCDGSVSVVTDPSGTLIDVCTTTGQRIYPVFPDYGYGYGGYVAPAYVNSNYYGTGFVNNGCPVGNFSCLGSYPYYTGTYANIFTANGCAVGDVACLGYIPSGFFNGVPTGATVTTGTTRSGVTTVTTTIPGQGQTVVYNPREVAQPAAVQPAVDPAPAAPAAGMATALNAAPAQAPAASSDTANVRVLSVQTTTAPVANDDGRDDGK